MPFLTQGKTNWKYILIVLVLAIIVGGGVLSYYRWIGIPKIKPPPVKEQRLAEETVKGYVNALMTRTRDNVLPYLTGEAKEEVQKWPVTFGTSNPHLESFEIISSKKLDTTEFEFVVREYQEYTGEGVIGYNDETLVVIKVNDKYLISSIKAGEYVDLKGTNKWKVYKDEEYGYEVKYPEKLNTEFISLYQGSIPPKIIVNPNISQLVCEEFERKSTVEFPTASQKKITVEGEAYCRFSGAEGTAGTTYVTYRYSTIKNEKQITLEFTLLYPDCGNYYGVDDKMEKCRQEEDTFNPDILAHQMLSTFRFLE